MVAHGVISRLRLSGGVRLVVTDGSEAGPSALSTLRPGAPIVFAVFTEARHHLTLVPTAMRTWCAAIRACLFFSDEANPSGAVPTAAVSYAHLPRHLDGYARAQLRYVPVLHAMRSLLRHSSLLSGARKSEARA